MTTPHDLDVAAVDRAHELDVLARLLDEQWRPVPPPPDPRAVPLAHAMRLIANALETNQ